MPPLRQVAWIGAGSGLVGLRFMFGSFEDAFWYQKVRHSECGHVCVQGWMSQSVTDISVVGEF